MPLARASDLLREELERRRAAKPEVLAARSDVNAFAEYCFTDEQGRAFVQAPHHRLLHEVASEYPAAIVWFPIEHGKTVQAKIKLLYELGTRPWQHLAYVSSKAKQAEKVVASVKREIEHNPRVREVFPGLRPQRSRSGRAFEEWGDTAFRVEGCPYGDKDPSLAAYGIDGQILGSRLHGIVIDNVLDRMNTATQVQRRRVLELIESEVLSRLLPGGWVLVIDTAWHEDDALHVLARREGWYSVRLDAELAVDGGPGPLWPEVWPRERLAEFRARMGKLAYDRMMRNKPLSSSIGLFTEEMVLKALRPELEMLREYDGDRPTCTGVDLAVRKRDMGDEVVFFTVILTESLQYRVIDITAGHYDGPQILRMMLDIYRRYHKGRPNALFMVEDNAAQEYILQLMRDRQVFQALGGSEKEFMEIQLRGFTTTANKRDEEYGIPSLANDFDMGRWLAPDTQEVRDWLDEAKRWSPDAHTGDRLMASWFAREGLRIRPPQVRLVQ